MPTEARVAVVPEDSRTLRIETVELPAPGPHQILVREHASGICHSQLHEIHGPRTSDIVLGHEATGTVLETGSAVDHVSPGDRVIVTWLPRGPGLPDRNPESAEVSQANGRPARSQGVFTWADHTLVDELYVVPIDAGVRTDVTAIIGCAVMTGSGAVLHTAGARKGDSIAIFGVGGVGLSAIAAARIIGADPIIAVDVDDKKLELARRHGATVGINAREVDPVEKIRELTLTPDAFDLMGQPIAGVDYAIDCIGAPETVRQILPAARNKRLGTADHGTAIIVGIPRENLDVSPLDIVAQEKRLTGSIGGSCVPARDFPVFLDWFESGQLDLDALVSQRFALDEINEAIAALEAGAIAGRAILEF